MLNETGLISTGLMMMTSSGMDKINNVTRNANAIDEIALLTRIPLARVVSGLGMPSAVWGQILVNY